MSAGGICGGDPCSRLDSGKPLSRLVCRTRLRTYNSSGEEIHGHAESFDRPSLRFTANKVAHIPYGFVPFASTRGDTIAGPENTWQIRSTDPATPPPAS